MIKPGIEPRSPRPLANTLLIKTRRQILMDDKIEREGFFNGDEKVVFYSIINKSLQRYYSQKLTDKSIIFLSTLVREDLYEGWWVISQKPVPHIFKETNKSSQISGGAEQ